MKCPFCDVQDTKVVDSRLSGEGDSTRRRRECVACGERFTTYEVMEVYMPRLIKKDSSIVLFREEKLRGGILRALEKRPVPIELIDAAVKRIIDKLRASGESEMPTAQVGDWVMQELKNLDKVAYIRFASVYKRFDNLEQFSKEITDLVQ